MSFPFYDVGHTEV